MATAAAEGLLAPGPMVPRPFAVARRERETADTWTLTLEPVDGPGVLVRPGQFVMAYVFGIGEVPISVSGPPGRRGPVVLTVRAVGAVTKAICAAPPGAVVGLRGPFGNAWPVDDVAEGHVVVVAGGIGLAPLRPVVLTALARRDRLTGATLLYGARTPGDLLYREHLAAWRGRLAVDVTVDAAEAGWRGKVGVVPKLIATASLEPGPVTAFLCGPEIMMRYAALALLERGVAAERIHVSLERNMRCGLGHCGHCQLGPTLICRDGPVYTWAQAAPWLEVREL